MRPPPITDRQSKTPKPFPVKDLQLELGSSKRPPPRYTGVRCTGDLLDIGVSYIIAGYAGYRYIGARSTGISLYFVLEFGYIEVHLTKTSFYRSSLYPKLICCAILPVELILLDGHV